MGNSLEWMTEMVLDIYYSSTQRDKLKLEVEYVDDIYNRRLELAHNDREKANIKKGKDIITGFNGTIVMPRTKDGVYYILISKAFMDEKLAFIGTIIHELTHIYDFIDFASEFCDDDYELIEQHDLYKIFYCWTEFNARRNGYSYYRKILFKIEDIDPDLNIEEQVSDILNTELVFQSDYLLKNLHVYNIIQFMGRFSAWENLFPDRINPHDYLPAFLQDTYGPKIIELYETLHSMVNFDIAKGKLGQLEDLMDSLF